MSFTAEDFGSGASLWESEFDVELPGNQAGSYIPTPPASVFPCAPKIDPFDTPAPDSGGPVDPGFGMGYGQVPLFSDDSVDDAVQQWQTQPEGLAGDDSMLENTFGSLGAEAWYTQLARTAAAIGTAIAGEKGLIPEMVKPALQQAGLLPTATPAPTPTTANTVSMGPPPPPAPAPAPGLPRWVFPAAVGGAVLLILMRKRR